jgi:NAD(P)-dependent dehydrogenase (short-subunit alcohol dehydrogenase family)
LISDNTSKAAVNHLTRVMAVSLAKQNITVNASKYTIFFTHTSIIIVSIEPVYIFMLYIVAPGVFPSKMTKFGLDNMGDLINMAQPMGRIGNAQDMAGMALFLSSRASAHITGAVVSVSIVLLLLVGRERDFFDSSFSHLSIYLDSRRWRTDDCGICYIKIIKN